VFVAGATFNVLFAFILATIVWALGQPESSDMASTRIGYVLRDVDLPDGRKVPGPAHRAGLQVGDTVVAIDGIRVNNWSDIQNSLVLGAGRTESGQRQVRFTIERDGTRREIVVEPVLAGEEKIRRVGIAPDFELLVHAAPPESVGAKAGFKADDEILRLDGTPIRNDTAFRSYLESRSSQPIQAVVRRAGQETTLTIPARPDAKPNSQLGLTFRTGFRIVHISPFEQIADVARWTVRTFKSLVSPSSDVGLDKMSGPVGIARILHSAAEVGMRAVLMMTILLNVNLAIFNLLPLPVLDGGQMLFATLAKLRGRPLPVNFIAATQSAFLVLLLSMVAYVTFFSDVPRWIRQNREERAAEAAAPAKK
jgi:regulator of sigma E protease